MAFNGGIWLAQLQALPGIEQALDGCPDTARLAAVRLHPQIFAHQRQRQWQPACRMYQLWSCTRINLLKARYQPFKKRDAVVFIQLVDYGCSVSGEVQCDVWEARCHQKRAVRTARFERQRLFKLPGVINDEEHTTHTDGGTNGRRPCLRAVRRQRLNCATTFGRGPSAAQSTPSLKWSSTSLSCASWTASAVLPTPGRPLSAVNPTLSPVHRRCLSQDSMSSRPTRPGPTVDGKGMDGSCSGSTNKGAPARSCVGM